MKDFKPDKSLFKDDKGRFITQSLFLENGYKTDFAVYSMSEEHKTYNDKVYPSIKQLYLEFGDVTEYEFARKYFYSWKHWQRIISNNVMKELVEECREELELSLRSEAVQSMIDLVKNEGSYQATKWLADRGWEVRKAGRPSKEEVEKEVNRMAKISEGIDSDYHLLEVHRKGK